MSNLTCVFWDFYWGNLATETVQGKKFEILGFENISSENAGKTEHQFSGEGTLWGFVHEGELKTHLAGLEWIVRKGQWFSFPFTGNLHFKFSQGSRVWVNYGEQSKGLLGMGGPVETVGRLRYIDGCTDTLLVAPPLIGEPCVNLLHFPPGVDQTAHYHPTSRSGIIHRGFGVCVSDKDAPMKEGTIFYLPAKTRHKFKTDTVDMDVISFHPDSDWGPTHEVHPMINRTWGTGHDER